jgi:hypothetical protein
LPWLALLFLLLWLRPATTRAEGFEKGVSLGLFAEDAGWSYRPLLDEIARTGADHVELVIPWYQEDGAATSLALHPRFSPPDETVRAAIRAAHAVGLKVLLFPIVRLFRPRPGEWRGTLAPQDRAAWWRSYRDRLLALARLGTAEGAEALSVGSELSTLDGERAPWAAAIAGVRRLYHGRLYYSGNWDAFRRVAFYDLVDAIGLCGYFALSHDEAGPVEALVRAWRDLRVELERFARKGGRPIVFTEVGYRSVAGAARAPWDETPGGTVDLDEQRRLYAAFRRVWQDAPADVLAGVYFWNYYGWGGPTSRSYTPRGKPALDEITRWFRAR